MEGKLGEIYVDIITRSDKLGNQLTKTTKEIELQGTKMSNSFTSSFSKGLNVLLGGVILYKVVNFFKKSIEAINAQTDAEAELRQQLGFTSQALLDQASAMQLLTKFGDEEIIAAQARIAAFTKDEEKIKLLTKATLDFAAAKKTDLASAGDLLAKTIGGEMNVLGRYGIKVDGAAGSTKRLMQVVEGVASLYGGQAEAAGRTFSGRLVILKNKVGELEEGIGKALVPTLEKLVGTFSSVADSTQQTSGFFQGVAAAGRIVGTVFIVVKTALMHIGTLLGTIGAGLYALFSGNFALIPAVVKDGFDRITSNAGNMFTEISKMWGDFNEKMAEGSSSGNKDRILPETEKALKARLDAETKYIIARDALNRASIRNQEEMDRKAIEDRLNAEIDAIKKRGETEKLSQATIDKEIAAASLQAQADLTLLLKDQWKARREEKQITDDALAEGSKWMDKEDTDKILTEQERAKQGAESFAQTVSNSFVQGIVAGENLGDVFKNMAIQLTAMIAQALIFKAIMSALGFASGPIGGFFSLFGAQGGSFQNGRKIAAFANGGSMTVPYMGLSGDSYPIMVKGGERVDVTPNYKVGQSEKVLSELVGRVEALTIATIKNANKRGDTYLYLDGKEVGKSIQTRQNEFDNGNLQGNR